MRLPVKAFAIHGQRAPWNGAPPWAIEIGWHLHWIRQLLQQEEGQMAQIDDEITQLTSDVAAERGAVDSAVTLINGFAAKLDAAVAAAHAAGATPAQLKAITDLSVSVVAQGVDLSAAVAANP